MALETKTFFEIAQKNDLISEAKLEKLRTGIKKATLSEVDFDALVSKKVLTQWQAKRFLSGKENFKVGRYRLLDFLGKDEFGEVYLVKGDSKSYLRLVSKELCADPNRREEYLDRVNAFKKLDLSRFPKITDVSEIGDRLIVVSDVVNGASVAKRCNGKSQSEKLVKQVTAKIAQAIIAMESEKLRHGSITEHTVIINESQKVVVHLPKDLSFDFRNQKHVSGDGISDVKSITNLACGMLAGDFENPKADTKLFKQLVEVIENESDSKTSLRELQAIVGSKAAPAPKNEEDDSVLDSVPPIPNLDSVSVNSELPSVNAEGLENITAPKEDMFGDLDDMSIESAIQVQPQKIIPAIVESDASSTKVTAKKKKPKESASDDNEPQPSSQKTIVFAALGGAAAALSIGLVVYFVFFKGAADDGNDGGSRVAKVASTSATDTSKSQPEKQNAESDSKDAKISDREKKKLETTSSGIFSKVGAFNGDAKTETSDLTPKPTNDEGGTEAEDDSKIGPKPTADTDVVEPKTGDPNLMAANDPAKNEPSKKSDEESKMENGEESAIVLVGKTQPKDKDDGKTKNDLDLDAIFEKARRAVTLPEPKSTQTKTLFDIQIPPQSSDNLEFAGW